MTNTRSWRELISDAMDEHGDTWDDVVSSTLSDSDLDAGFDPNHGTFAQGRSFTLWTAKRVYFPAGYDGSEWAESVSREPDGKPTKHVGGGI